MTINLIKINPKFRQLVDLLLFSDRMDLDLSEFKSFLKENYDINFEYVWDRFIKSSEIFWENGEQFWSHRLSFLLGLNERNLSKSIEEHLEKRMFNLIRVKEEANILYDIEYLQFLEYCKIKSARQESLISIKNYLTELPAHIKFDKLINIISSFVPIVFADINEYAEAITKKITQSARSFDLLIALEKHGVSFDKQPIVKLAREIIVERARNEKNCRAFFTILNNTEIRTKLKQEYKPSYRKKLLDLLDCCDYHMIEEHHLCNIKNLIELDNTIADELSIIYADKLYHRNTGHKKANADKLIRLLKTIPQIVPKKILAYLSSHNKMSDIKYILSAFPELRKLAAFV
jgi:hypothetical protein